MLYFSTHYTFMLLISSLPVQVKQPDVQVSSLDHSDSLAYFMTHCNHEVIKNE